MLGILGALSVLDVLGSVLGLIGLVGIEIVGAVILFDRGAEGEASFLPKTLCQILRLAGLAEAGGVGGVTGILGAAGLIRFGLGVEILGDGDGVEIVGLIGIVGVDETEIGAVGISSEGEDINGRGVAKRAAGDRKLSDTIGLLSTPGE